MTETIEVLVPLFTTLVGVGGTLGGVAISQHASNKRERERAKENRADTMSARVRETAQVVHSLLTEEGTYFDHLRSKYKGEGWDAAAWDAAYETHVYDELMSPLNTAIALIPNAIARSQLAFTTRALTSGLVVNGGSGDLPFMGDLVLGAAGQICSAYARGEEPDADALARLERVLDWVHATEGDTHASYMSAPAG